MKALFQSSLIIFSFLIFLTFSGHESFGYPSGAPAGKTGSPGDGSTCTSCHGGSSSNVSGWITSNIPADGYTPGSSYTITVTVSGSGYKGFEVSPQNVSGALLGTLTAGSSNHLVGSGKYVTQNSKVNSNPATWSFTWTAPAAGTGNVTFYGAFTVSEPVTKLSTLVVSEYVPPVPLSVTASANPSSICSGFPSQLNAVASGGSGTYTYSWTSNPPGFASNLQNPVVMPDITTQYTVVVNDGINNASASTTITVTQPATADAGNDTIVDPAVTQIQLNGTATNYTYVLWSTSGDGTFSNTAILAPLYFPGNNDKSSGSVYLTLTAYANSPCSSTTSTIHIGFILPLAVTATATPSLICNGQTSQLNAMASGGSGTYSYTWSSVPAGYSSNLQDPVVQPVVNTQYIVTVADGTSNVTDDATVTVTQPPTASAGNDTTCNIHLTEIQLHGTATNYSGVQWTTTGDGTFQDSGLLNSVYTFGAGDKSSGSVTLTLSATPLSPCSGNVTSAITIQLEEGVGLNDAGKAFSFNVTPNPSNGIINIICKNCQERELIMTVHNINGQTLSSETVDLSPGVPMIKDLSSLPKGVYFINFKTISGTVTRKIILQ